MEYINKKTKAIIETESELKGDWVSISDFDNDLDKLTVPQIKQKLEELGIEFNPKANKAELWALLQEQE